MSEVHFGDIPDEIIKLYADSKEPLYVIFSLY